MNKDIRDGALLLAKGLKAEAHNFKDKLMAELDENHDGRIEFDEVKNEVVREAKAGMAKLNELASDEELPAKVKAEVDEAIAKIKPMVEAAKKEASEAVSEENKED